MKNTIIPVFFAIALMSNGLAQEVYDSTQFAGKNKYQRINTIEEYLEKLSRAFRELKGDVEKNTLENKKAIVELERTLVQVKLPALKKENEEYVDKQIGPIKEFVGKVDLKTWEEMKNDIAKLKDSVQTLELHLNAYKQSLKQLEAMYNTMQSLNNEAPAKKSPFGDITPPKAKPTPKEAQGTK